jgi:hypothetical protein
VIDNRRMPRASGGHFGPLEQKALLAALVDVFAPILVLLEAAVLSAGFDNSIGGCLGGWLTGTANPAHGGDTRRVVELSPRLSLRRAKTAYPEPTPANSLDRGSRE